MDKLDIKVELFTQKKVRGIPEVNWIVELGYKGKSKKFPYHTVTFEKPSTDLIIEALAIDCATAKMSYPEYLNEFGYDPSDADAKFIYDMCQNNYQKMVELFGDELVKVIDGGPKEA